MSDDVLNKKLKIYFSKSQSAELWSIEKIKSCNSFFLIIKDIEFWINARMQVESTKFNHSTTYKYYNFKHLLKTSKHSSDFLCRLVYAFIDEQHFQLFKANVVNGRFLAPAPHASVYRHECNRPVFH